MCDKGHSYPLMIFCDGGNTIKPGKLQSAQQRAIADAKSLP